MKRVVEDRQMYHVPPDGHVGCILSAAMFNLHPGIAFDSQRVGPEIDQQSPVV
jgi:hypothetical protein